MRRWTLTFSVVRSAAEYAKKEGKNLKKIFKKAVSLLTAALIVLPSITLPASAADDAVASVVFGKEVKSEYVTSVKCGPDGTFPYTVVEKDGKFGWSLAPGTASDSNYVSYTRNKNGQIYIDLSKTFAYKVKDRNVYEVEVEYFDEGNGHFRVMYDGLTDPWKDPSDKSTSKTRKTEIVYLENTGKWKTHTFRLENPSFSDNFKGFDIALATYEDAMGTTLENVTFGGVKVRRTDVKSDISFNLTTDNIGNNFFSDEEIKINYTAYNTSKTAKETTAEVKIVDFYGKETVLDGLELSIPAGSKVSGEIIVPTPEYSTYTIYLTADADGTHTETHTEFAYIVRAEKHNPVNSVNNHMHRLETRNPETIIPLMDKAGFGDNREGIWMTNFSDGQGGYALTARNIQTTELLEKHNINTYMIINGPSMKDGSIEEMKRYVRELATAMKDHTSIYAFYNELNAHIAADVYAEWAIEASKVLKEVNPDNKFILGETSGVPLEWLKEVMTIAKGYFDGISIHPYGMQTSPTYSERYEAILACREMMEREGYGDMPLYVSEMGWSTGWVGYEKQAAYLVHYYAMAQAPELGITETQIYDFQDDGYHPEDQENNFGMIRTWDTVDVPNIAKPSLLAMAYVNQLLTGAQYVDRKADKVGSNIYRFKTTDGKDVAIIWSESENDYETFSFGTDNVEIYDMFGNKKEIFNYDGKYSFVLNPAPYYVIGHFSEVTEAEPVFDISNTDFTMPYGDTAEIVIKNNSGYEAEVEFITWEESDRVTVKNHTGFVNGVDTITFSAEGLTGSSEEAQLIIKGKNGEVYIDTVVNIAFEDKLKLDYKTELYGDGNLNRWVGVMTVKNNSHSETVKGKIEFASPEEFTRKLKPISIGEIKPEEEKVISFNLPEVMTCTSYYMDMNVVLDSGYSQNVSLYADCGAALYADVKPTIDAVKSDGEWNDRLHFRVGDGSEDELQEGAYDGDNDLSVDYIIEWDEEYMYLYAEVTDDIMDQQYQSAAIWAGDSIQFGLSYGGIVDKTKQTFTEIGIALTSDGPTIQSYSVENGVLSVSEKSELAVARRGNKTIYELRMPWSELVSPDAVIEPGAALRFNLIVNDSDGNGRWGWVEYSSGIGRYKNATEFGYLNLIKQ